MHYNLAACPWMPGVPRVCDNTRITPWTSQMAGYSKTSLALKLGLVAGRTLNLLNAPPDFESLLAPLPEGAAVTRRTRGPLRLALLFCTDRDELKLTLPELVSALHPDGMLWVAWPKKSSGVPSTLNENAVRATGLLAGVVDNKVCAIDEVWSGLRFQFRLQDRAARRAPRAA